MIACVEDGTNLHSAKWTGRVRLHAGVRTYCGREADGANGVLQVPDAVFTQGVVFTIEPGKTRKACGACRLAMQASIS